MAMFLRIDFVFDIGHYFFNSLFNLLIISYFLAVVNKHDIAAASNSKKVLGPAVGFAQAALQEVALYCSFKEALRNRNHHPVAVCSVCVVMPAEF